MYIRSIGLHRILRGKKWYRKSKGGTWYFVIHQASQKSYWQQDFPGADVIALDKEVYP